jgi:CRISPR-associated endonuclease Cas1
MSSKMHSQTTAVPVRKLERRRDWNLATAPLRKLGEIVVVDGYGVSVRIHRSQLVVTDGAGLSRRERHFGRATSKLARLVVLGGSGSLTLEAIRWLGDVGAVLVCIDRDGHVLCTSAPIKSEAKLRRAQALALYSGAGLDITRAVLSQKLSGQQQLLDQLDPDPYAERVLERALAAVEAAESVEDAVAAEAEAAAAYWSAWADVEVRFQPADMRRVPEHWRTFRQRTSPLGSGPRMAVNPAGAILNYLYALLEAEARLACQIVGLDPALAIVHADTRGRDSLPLDLMEAVRPSVDRYLLALLRDRVFRASDFHETQRGNCRLLAPLTHELAGTLPAWRQLVAPVAEQVASLLLQRAPSVEKLPTPLTEGNRRADRARRRGRTAATEKQPPVPQPERRCKRCGGRLPARERTYCDDCLPHYQRDRYDAFIAAGRETFVRRRESGIDPSHGGDAANRRGETTSRRKRELQEWEAAHPATIADPGVFAREILPAIQKVPLAELVRATGLTRGYLSQVRRGGKVPHSRHWPALRTAGLPTQEGSSR